MKWEQQFGERISQLRRERNLTRAEFGALVGLSEQYVGRIERGQHTISGAAINQICDKIGISADYIVRGKVDLVYTIADFNALSIEQAKITLDIAMNVVTFLCTHNGNSALLQEALRQHHAATAFAQNTDIIIPNSRTFDKGSTP